MRTQFKQNFPPDAKRIVNFGSAAPIVSDFAGGPQACRAAVSIGGTPGSGVWTFSWPVQRPIPTDWLDSARRTGLIDGGQRASAKVQFTLTYFNLRNAGTAFNSSKMRGKSHNL
jgi:hypothetical protein